MTCPPQARSPVDIHRGIKHATVYRAAVVLNAVIAWTRQLSDPP
ncbi:MAG: hypothetical protein ACREMZ_16880 [Gemmatimonadales bacterium]